MLRRCRHLPFVRACAIALSACLASAACGAQAAPPASGAQIVVARSSVGVAPAVEAELALDTEHVVVFKDGYALFVKSARGRADANGLVYTDQVPDAAVLGTFWASHDGRVLGMRAEEVEVRTTRTVRETAIDLADLLRANLGREVELYLRSSTDDGPLRARIVELLEQPRDVASVVAVPSSEHATPVRLTPSGGAFVMIERQGTHAVVAVADIARIDGGSLATSVERTEVVAEQRKRLVFDLGSASAGADVELHLIYFRPGVRWIPTYRFSDGSGGQGELSLQAEILNEAEDIDEARVSLVVGVPNFRFKEVVSPLVLEETLHHALRQAAPGLMGQGSAMSNAVYTQRASEWRDPNWDSAPVVAGGELEAMVGGGAAQDLYVYEAGTLALGRGARATMPLWRQKVARRDVYTLQLSPSLVASSSSGYYGQAGGAASSPLSLATNEVWHQLELDNGASQPWTTGAALLLADDGLPLAQELLTYTPGGSRVRVPVTVAVDVRGSFASQELSRTPGVSLNGYTLTRIESKASVEVVNHRKETVTVQVELSLDGRAHDATSKGQIAQQSAANTYYGRFNPRSTVTWELTLAPGARQSVEVELESYVY